MCTNFSLFTFHFSLLFRTFAAAKKNRGVAQLVAFLVWDQAVAGSSPVTSTMHDIEKRKQLFPKTAGL